MINEFFFLNVPIDSNSCFFFLFSVETEKREKANANFFFFCKWFLKPNFTCFIFFYHPFTGLEFFLRKKNTKIDTKNL